MYTSTMSLTNLLFLPFLILCGSRRALSGNILVLPGEHSHWLNMRAMVEELVNRNNSVTVLVHSATPSVNYTRTERFRFEVFPVRFTKTDMDILLHEFISFWTYESHDASTVKVLFKIRDMLRNLNILQKQICDGMLRNMELLDKLRRYQYKVVLADPASSLCGDLLAEILGIPLVFSIRFSFGHTMEGLCGQLLTPPSFVPATPVQYSDRMSFVERLTNVLLYAIHTAFFHIYTLMTWDNYHSEVIGKPTTFCEVMSKADIWLIRTYWDFDYPRPFLPNFQFVGGLHCRPAEPLLEHMKEFVQSSGDDGIVVFSLGSMVANLTHEKANMIASALGQIPQKVLWRYRGVKPDTLAPNTRIYDWIPQNDLLGHPKTRAFITHGGTNGLYEAIYHGVPMVGIPLFADQSDNMSHMRHKGAAVVLDINQMQSQDLVDALNTVIYNLSYKESVMRLSQIHHDQPMTPLERAVFWIEFVMRNKGAKHLRVQAHNLTWYQYYCLDVFAVLLTSVVLVLFVVLKTCSCCVRLCWSRLKRKSKTE